MRLILLNLALLGAVTYQVAAPEAPVSAPPPARPRMPELTQGPSAAAPAAPRRDYTIVADRPIFFADRQIPAPEAVVESMEEDALLVAEDAPVDTAPPVDVQLLGTVITGAVTLALLEPAGGEPLRAAVGDLVAGWTIEDIQPEVVRLSGAEGERQLKIERGTSRAEGKPVTRSYGNRGQLRPATAAPGNRQAGPGRGDPVAATPGRTAAEQALVEAAARQAGGGAIAGRGAGGGAGAQDAGGGTVGAGDARRAGDAPGAGTVAPGSTSAAPQVGSDGLPANNIITPVVPVGGGGFNANSVQVDANGNIITRNMAEYMQDYEAAPQSEGN